MYARQRKQHQNQWNIEALKDPEIKDQFRSQLEQVMQTRMQIEPLPDANTYQRIWTDAFHETAQAVLPESEAQKLKPWTSQRTLHYIHKRNEAAKWADRELQRHFNKLIKRSVKQDRESWFVEILNTQDWQAVHKLRKSNQVCHTKLKYKDKSLCIDERSEGLAQYLEEVQWAVRPDTVQHERNQSKLFKDD